MKLKLLFRLVEKLLGEQNSDAPRADMYLPERLLAMGLVFIATGIGFGGAFVITSTSWMLAVAIGGVLLGIFALLNWKNQKIRIISDEEFEYTTILGNTHTYAFKDITGLRKNQDSMTLFIGKNKVHIESMAVLSERLVELINEALKKANAN